MTLFQFPRLTALLNLQNSTPQTEIVRGELINSVSMVGIKNSLGSIVNVFLICILGPRVHVLLISMKK